MTREKALQRLTELYKEVPSFECLPGCTDCCGPIFFSGLEASLIKVQKVPKSTKCPYAKKGRCGIYECRPMICRLFGAVDDPKITCSFGCGPVFKIEDDHAKWLLTEVMRLSEQIGLPGMYETHKAFLDSAVSPSKIPVHLPKYDFK